MDIGRITLTLSLAAAIGLVTGEVRAQEFDLPPVPSSPTEKGGTAFSAENGPCFYNAYTWIMTGRLNQSVLAAEMQDLAGLGTNPGSGCLGHYALTAFDLYGPWSYMLSDGVPRPERVSQARVKAVWEASRKAEAEKEKLRLGHDRVPTIGNGYGSDEDMTPRTVVFKVAPAPSPATYNGIPIIERNRSWERFQTTDGQRVWREFEPAGDSYRARAGVRNGADVRERFRPDAADRLIQMRERSRAMSRSTGASYRPDRSASGSSASPSSGTEAKSQGSKVARKQ